MLRTSGISPRCHVLVRVPVGRCSRLLCYPPCPVGKGSCHELLLVRMRSQFAPFCIWFANTCNIAVQVILLKFRGPFLLDVCFLVRTHDIAITSGPALLCPGVFMCIVLCLLASIELLSIDALASFRPYVPPTIGQILL